jgi:hypothetical protein
MTQETNCATIAVSQCVTRREVFLKAENIFQEYQPTELTSEDVGADKVLIALTLLHSNPTDCLNEMSYVISMGCKRKMLFQLSYTREDKNKVYLTSTMLK